MNNNNLNSNKICLINAYFGQWPKWIATFLDCCKKNSEIDFIFFSDNDFSQAHSGNIKHIRFTLDNFNLLTTKKLGLEIHVTYPYKVCDFRPAFGIIFKDYIIDYDYWGFCDLDIVFGNIENYFKSKIKNKYDLISGYSYYVSGPMCLLRNNILMNTLYTKGLNYKKILQSNIYEGFDEGLLNTPKSSWTFRKVLIFLSFIFISEIGALKSGLFTIRELKFMFYFYYKNRNILIPHDFSEIVLFSMKNRIIKASLDDFIYSDAFFERKKIINWSVRYSNGRLVEINSKMKVLVFHFRLSKNKKEFNVNKRDNISETFEITQSGIKYC